ncbi:MAG: hypothetical protein PBU97_03250 [Stenotrophomonas maltophilia]
MGRAACRQRRTGTGAIAGAPWLAELQLQVRWGEGEREQLRWRSLRLLPPDLESAR